MPQPTTRQAFTIPGMDRQQGEAVVRSLEDRLRALLDLSLVLKHVHWNVVGPTFIGVHQMLDPQVDAVRLMVDAIAERIATLGASPNGLAGHLVSSRSWEDYSIGRALVVEHLAALDLVYDGVVIDHRRAIDELDALDPVSQDMLIQQSEQLEQFQWFVRAHLEDGSGTLANGSAGSEREAARQAVAVSNGERSAAGSASTTAR